MTLMQAHEREEFESLCAAYVLDALEPEEALALEEMLVEATPEQQQIFDDMCDTALFLPLSVEVHDPPSSCKASLMAAVTSGVEGAATVAVTPDPAWLQKPKEKGSQRAPVLPWWDIRRLVPLWAPLGAAAALCVIVGVLSWNLIAEKRALNDEYLAQRSTNKKLKQRIEVLQTVFQKQAKQLRQQQKTLVALRGQLQQKVALLNVLRGRKVSLIALKGGKPQPDGYGKVIWDEKRRKGILQLANLPAHEEDKCYQLWLFKRGRKAPISAGVFYVKDADKDRFFQINSLSEGRRRKVKAFAISLEPKGGKPQPTGPVMLIGT